MSQTFTDFSEYAHLADPADWTSQWNAASDREVRDQSAQDDGKQFHIDGGGTGHQAHTWDDAPSAPSGIVQYYVKYSQGDDAYEPTLAFRVAGSAGSEQGYRLGVNARFSDLYIRCDKISAGTASELGRDSIPSVDEPGVLSAFGQNLLVELEEDTPSAGDLTIRAKWWTVYEEEPSAWQLEIVDSSPHSNGPAGIYMEGFDDQRVRQFSVSDAGDAISRTVLPLEPDEVVATNVSVTEADLTIASEAYVQGARTHSKTIWQLSTSSTMSPIVYDSGEVDDLLSHHVTGLSANTDYYARARAVDDQGTKGDWSPVTTTHGDFTTADGSPPDAPTISVPDVAVTQATLEGDAISGGSGTHEESQWQVATDSGFSTVVYDDTSTENLEGPHMADGLAPQTDHWARVRYKNSDGLWSDWSASVSFTTDAGGAVSKPTLSTEDLTATSVILRTSDYSGANAHAATDWQVATDSGFTSLVFDDEDNGTDLLTAIIVGLDADTDYWARARHVDTDGVRSAWSDAVSFTTLALDGEAPGIPTVTVDAVSRHQASFSTTQSGDYATWFLSVHQDGRRLVRVTSSDTVNIQSWAVSNLPPGQTFWITARHANDKTGGGRAWGPWSTPVSFTTDPAFPHLHFEAPTALEGIAPGSFTVQWDYDATGDFVVDLELSRDFGETWERIASDVTGTSYSLDLSNEQPGTHYVLRGRVRNTASGEVQETWSSEPFGITGGPETVYRETAADRVNDGDLDLSEWTDRWHSDDGDYDGSEADGLIRHSVPVADLSQHPHVLERDEVPAGETLDVAARGRTLGGAWEKAGLSWWGFWDQEGSSLGVAGLTGGGDSGGDKTGIFAFFEATGIWPFFYHVSEPYDDVGVDSDGTSFAIRYFDEGAETGIETMTAPGAFYASAPSPVDQEEWYTIRLRITTVQAHPDGTRDLRVQGQVHGRGLDVDGWLIDEVLEKVDLPSGKAGLLSQHGTHGTWSHETGSRVYDEFTAWSEPQEIPEEEQTTGLVGCPPIPFTEETIVFMDSGAELLYHSTEVTDADTAFVARLRTNAIAPGGAGGEALFTNLYLSLVAEDAASIDVTPIVDGELITDEKVTVTPSAATTGVPERFLYEIGLGRDAGANRQGLRGTWCSALLEVTNLGSCARLVLEGIEIETEVVTEGVEDRSFTEEALQLRSTSKTVRWFMDSGAQLLEGASGSSDDGADVEALAETNAVAPAGIGGEAILTNLYLTIARDLASALTLRITPILDGDPQTPLDLELAATTNPVREEHEFGLSVPYPSAENETHRFAMRGTWFRARVETVGALPDGMVVIEGLDVESEVVTEGKEAANASA